MSIMVSKEAEASLPESPKHGIASVPVKGRGLYHSKGDMVSGLVTVKEMKASVPVSPCDEHATLVSVYSQRMRISLCSTDGDLASVQFSPRRCGHYVRHSKYYVASG